MAFVPGFENDIVISYAHGDDREWIIQFFERLKIAMKRWLGFEAKIWIDQVDLPPSADFSTRIPEEVTSSAVFVFFASPLYVRSWYCIDQESQAFARTIQEKRVRFDTQFLKHQLFAFRCPILPVRNNKSWRVFEGATDVAFCDKNGTFGIGTLELDSAFRTLTGHLVKLLEAMRNHCTPVIVHPWRPTRELKDAHQALTLELNARGYRILPDDELDPSEHLSRSKLAVFLLGSKYDQQARDLSFMSAQMSIPWFVWFVAEPSVNWDEKQLTFRKKLDLNKSEYKVYLGACSVRELKKHVLDRLGTEPEVLPTTTKPQVSLIYNSKDMKERENAGFILEYDGQYDFRSLDNTARRNSSDGILLVWGTSDQRWWEARLSDILGRGRAAQVKGLCLFDPACPKEDIVNQVIAGLPPKSKLHVSRHYGQFQEEEMEPFFEDVVRRLRRRARAVARAGRVIQQRSVNRT